MYNRTVKGPRLERAFTVTTGLVAVVGDAGSIPLCPGALWPGLASLPPTLRERLRPRRSLQTEWTDIRLVDPGPLDVQAAVAYLTGLLLRSGPPRERLKVLDTLVPVAALSRETGAALLGTHPTVIGREAKGLGL